MIAERSVIDDAALESTAVHLVGQCRALMHQLEAAVHELGSLHDARAMRVIEACEMTLREPAGPGSLRHVEQAGTALLRSLVEAAG